MSINAPKLLSGRVPVTPYGDLTNDRYQFLGLSEAEPSLGVPTASGSLFTSTSTGTRSWSNVININSNVITFYEKYDFPNSLGNAGEVLTTDGTGNLTFTALTTGSSIANGNSNVSIPTANGNIYINANSSSDYQWVFDTTGNLTAPGTINFYSSPIGPPGTTGAA